MKENNKEILLNTNSRVIHIHAYICMGVWKILSTVFSTIVIRIS